MAHKITFTMDDGTVVPILIQDGIDRERVEAWAYDLASTVPVVIDYPCSCSLILTGGTETVLSCGVCTVDVA